MRTYILKAMNVMMYTTFIEYIGNGIMHYALRYISFTYRPCTRAAAGSSTADSEPELVQAIWFMLPVAAVPFRFVYYLLTL